MTILVKIVEKDFNSELLRQELEAAGFPAPKYKGFAGIGRTGRYTPNAATKVIARRTVQGGPDFEDSADPGELRFTLDAPLTASQETNLDGILAAHDSTQHTEEQARGDTDQTDYQQLLSDFNNFDSMSLPEKDVVLKRLVRLLVRRELRAPI